MDLFQFADGSAVSPGEGATDEVRRKFNLRAKKAWTYICLAIEPEQQVHVRETTTAKEAWDTLRGQFARESLLQKVRLRQQYYSCRFQNGNNMLEHISPLKSLHDQLYFEIPDNMETLIIEVNIFRVETLIIEVNIFRVETLIVEVNIFRVETLSIEVKSFRVNVIIAKRKGTLPEIVRRKRQRMDQAKLLKVIKRPIVRKNKVQTTFTQDRSNSRQCSNSSKSALRSHRTIEIGRIRVPFAGRIRDQKKLGLFFGRLGFKV